MAKGLTEKQRKILEHIIDFQRDNGFPPTIRELGEAFSIGSLRGVTVHLDALVRKGYMTRERTSRSIRVTAPDPRHETPAASEDMIALPLVSGAPAEEQISGKVSRSAEIERYISLPKEIGVPATDKGFVIRVGATGVVSEPILPGDFLVVRPQQTAMQGELVVTLSYGDMLVSRAEVSKNEEASTLPDKSNELIGRVVGLVRRY